MEPMSIVSLAGACLTLVVRTTRDLNDIAAKFHKMEQMVRLLVAQLNTITTTLAQLERWLNGQPDLGSDVSGALVGAIEACITVVNELAGFVARLKGGWLSSRLLWIWDEGQFAQYQRALDSQITALGLFLNVILLTPLHVANGAAIAALIQLGADTCARDETDQVPLHRLAADGLLAGVDAVLAAGSSPVDAQNKARQTPLHLACQNDHHDVAHALLRAGAYVNAADRDGLRPLHYLARHGRPPLVRLLRDANADVEAQALHLSRPLHDAARTGCPAVVEALLAASADTEATTDDGSTPLHLAVAATNDAAATVAALLAARANVAAETSKNEQPLHLALRRGSVAVAALLLQHGADANARLRDGTVPLIQACSSTAAAQNTLSTVEILLAHGADPSATNCPGASPLSAACSRPELASDLVRLLVANGASPRHQDFRALWRNGKLSIWEKRAAHAIMTEAAVPELRKSEVEWLMVAR
ncbi:putative ankyrin repeat containing protein [Diplodia seriata]|uniref:Putative ankyrin repeat containing protein n=1 Tax=Diplodia seriata TaxID=420778 RepID=A0A0G2DSX7_9PEZI|nr:putative ankyrin repeat containing protein [Diplodia seriata]